MRMCTPNRCCCCTLGVLQGMMLLLGQWKTQTQSKLLPRPPVWSTSSLMCPSSFVPDEGVKNDCKGTTFCQALRINIRHHGGAVVWNLIISIQLPRAWPPVDSTYPNSTIILSGMPELFRNRVSEVLPAKFNCSSSSKARRASAVPLSLNAYS